MALTALVAMFADKEVDLSAHLGVATDYALYAIALLAAFFVVRPELWRRLFFDRIDPRPAALTRIAFGIVVLWTFLDLLMPHGPLTNSVAHFLFTDEGMWLTNMARHNYGGELRTLWDPEHGFEKWWYIVHALRDRFTILHIRSDPPFVWTLYTAMSISVVLMIFGVWTRWTTLLSWILVEQLYRYSPIFYTGGDTVVRVFLFLGVFARWGEAYSIDAWRRRRKALLKGGADRIPALRRIPAWPIRLMMLQLTIIYCATGLLKSGITWRDGTALYYALNLDHFYRWPQTAVATWGQFLGILPVVTVFVHWWEVLFPIALVGVAVNAYEREVQSGLWPQAARWRRILGWLLFAGAWGLGAYIAGLGAYYYVPDEVLQNRISRDALIPLVTAATCAAPIVLLGLALLLRSKFPQAWDVVRYWLLGKRFWLLFGFAMHIGIDIGMNVGTFAEVMMAVYFVWLSGEEVDAFWRYLHSRPLAPGEQDRPVRNRRWVRLLLAPMDRLLYRKPGPTYTVLHHPSEASVRRVALLRLWDLGHALDFAQEADVAPEHLAIRPEGQTKALHGPQAGAILVRIFPGLFWLRPLRLVANDLAGAIALKVLRQR